MLYVKSIKTTPPPSIKFVCLKEYGLIRSNIMGCYKSKKLFYTPIRLLINMLRYTITIS